MSDVQIWLDGITAAWKDLAEACDAGSDPGHRAALASARAALGMDQPPPTPEEAFDRSAEVAMLWLDALAADHLAELSPEGAAVAVRLREAAIERWLTRRAPATDLWVRWRPEPNGNPAPFVRHVMRLAGGNATRPSIAPARLGVTVLAMPVVETLLDALGPSGRPPLAGSLDAHRLIRWLVAEIQAEGAAPDGVVSVEGWQALAWAIGGSDRTRKALPGLVEALMGIRIPGPAPGVHTFIVGAGSSSSATVEIRVSDAALARGPNRLVPIPAMPPAIGRRAEHAGQAALQLALLVLFRDRAGELLRAGGTTLGRGEGDGLARRVGLPPSVVRTLIATWSDGGAGERLLRLVGPDRVTIADDATHAALLTDARRLGEL